MLSHPSETDITSWLSRPSVRRFIIGDIVMALSVRPKLFRPSVSHVFLSGRIFW